MITGEQDAGKLACSVREGADGKGPGDRDLAGGLLHRAVVLWEASQQPAPAAPRPRPSYADLFPACPCGDVADSRDGMCDRCASDREWRASRESRQREFVNGRIDGSSVFQLNPLAE